MALGPRAYKGEVWARLLLSWHVPRNELLHRTPELTEKEWTPEGNSFNSGEALRQWVTVAVSYFEDALNKPPLQFLFCRLGRPEELVRLLGDDRIPVRDLVFRRNRRSLHCAIPDFLSRSVALERKATVGLRPSFSAQVRLGEPRAPVWICGPDRGLGGSPAASHISKNERDAPNFLYAALDRTACAPFFSRKAHEVQGTHETPQEIGGVGHPAIGAGIEPTSALIPPLTCYRHAAPNEQSVGPRCS
jgi:hypothetical protein